MKLWHPCVNIETSAGIPCHEIAKSGGLAGVQPPPFRRRRGRPLAVFSPGIISRPRLTILHKHDNRFADLLIYCGMMMKCLPPLPALCAVLSITAAAASAQTASPPEPPPANPAPARTP